MASNYSVSPIVLLLSTFLVLLLSPICEAKTSKATAPGPTPAPLDLTGVLEKGGKYTTLMRLLKETEIGEEMERQLNDSLNGLTIFAPTDNAFNRLKAGTLNSLTPQEQASLVLYHVLPRYYSLATFETTSNPVRTQASGNKGVYSVNITTTSSSSSNDEVINVSTGVDDAQINNKLYSEFPLAVYSVDSVLLPYDIFGAKPPPGPGSDKPAKVTPAAKAHNSTSEDSTAAPSTAATFRRKATAVWGFAATLGFMSLVSSPLLLF